MAKIALITGMSNEAKIIRTQIRGVKSSQAKVYVAGMGAPNGVEVVEKAIKNGAQAIVSIGVCGAIDSELFAGQIVVPEQVYTLGTEPVSYPDLSIEQNWRKAVIPVIESNYFVTSAPLLSVDKQISTVEDKQKLHAKTLACAVDMESGIIGTLAKKHGLPFVVVRVVIDVADQAIPAAFENVVKSDGSFSVFELIKGLIFKWPGVKALERLIKHNTQAMNNLAGITRLLLPDFKRPT